MNNTINIERYSRQILLNEIGLDGQEKLSKASVLVVGAGGLGCPVLQYLVGAGVGNIGIVDNDTVALSNLHRQILFTQKDIGKNKALVAKQKLQGLNQEISITAFSHLITSKNALSLIKNFDVVVDCSDNFSTRYLVNDACLIENKPLVFGAIFKFEGQVSVFNYKTGPSYRCLFPKPPKAKEVPSCNEAGVLGVLPGIIGVMQANEVLKIILNIGEVLSGKILTYNTLNNQSSVLKFKRNPAVIESVLASKDTFVTKDYNFICEIDDLLEVSIEEILHEDIQLIDIREEHEKPNISNLNIKKFPLSKIENLYNNPPKGKVVLFCQSGVRSKKTAQQLHNLGHTNFYSLKEGVYSLIKNLKTT